MRDGLDVAVVRVGKVAQLVLATENDGNNRAGEQRGSAARSARGNGARYQTERVRTRIRSVGMK